MNKEQIFKWIKAHDPSKNWDFSNLHILEEQFVNNISECGTIDIGSLIELAKENER